MSAANDSRIGDRSTVVDPGLSLVGTRAGPSVPPSMPRVLARGATLDRYMIVEELGAGGFGRVYAAYDPDLDRKVALKVMKTRWNALGSAREQLLREAQALARLSHENVVTVYDVGEADEDFYLSMEFIDGFTLKEWFAAEMRGWQEVRDVMIAAGRGLASAHAAGIVHSDFKPHNVLVDRRGRVAVADFGLARALAHLESAGIEFDQATASDDDDPEATLAVRRHRTTIPVLQAPLGESVDGGFVAGSPAYMAPERFAHDAVDERADQFSYCVTLFEGLYGCKPFPQRTLADLRAAIEYGHIEMPADRRGVPDWLEEICLRGLRVAPHERFDSMDELLAALASDPTAKRAQRRTILITAGVSAALAVALTTALRTDPDPEAQNQIDSLAAEARAAAARNYFVRPPVDEPQYPTAYRKVLELEKLNGNADPDADDLAQALRQEFSATLIRVGDYYWEAAYGRPFAYDYYTEALVFDPENEHAKSRSTATLGQLADLERKAATLEFSAGELVAAEPLAALATERLSDRAAQLAELRLRDRPRSTTSQESLDFVTRITELMADTANASSSTTGSVSAIKTSKLVADASGAQDRSSDAGFALPLPQADSPIAEKAAASVGTPTADTDATATANPTVVDSNGRSGAARSVEDADLPSSSPAKTTRSDKKAAEAATTEGRQLMRQGDLQSAAQSFHRALRSNRRSSAALMGLSDVYFELGDYHKAVEYGERGVTLAPRRAQYRVSLGDAYQKVLRYADAKRQYEAGVERGSRVAKRRLSQLKEKLGE